MTLDRTPFTLLIILTLLPAVVVLWFMNEAMSTRASAARQQVRDANRGQLRLVRSQVETHWRAHAERLRSKGSAEARFLRIVDAGADGAIVLDHLGEAVFPDVRRRPGVATIDAEQRIQSVRAADRGGRDAGIFALAAALNDYRVSLSGADRFALMQELRQLSPNVQLPTQAALQLSLGVLDAGRPLTAAGFRETAVPDVWAFVAEDEQTIALYRTGRIEAMMHDFLHEVTPAGVRFIAFPPEAGGDAEAIAAGPWLPGWQLSYQLLDPASFDASASPRARLYVVVAAGGIALTMLVGIAAGGAVRRHLRLARLKTDLVAAASHELRTPLASMRVLVDGLLDDRELDPIKTRQYLELIATENARLSRLIDNFLTFARLDSRRYQFAFAAAQPSTIVANAVDAIRDRLPPRCELRVDAPSDLPPLVADAEALCMALINLLDNAVKYSSGDTPISVRAVRDGDAHLAFVVEDRGIGIPAREQRRIFRRFYRVDRRLARETAGVGLGLSIVELITRGHRGTVTVQSAPGKGSTFTLRIPYAAASVAA